MQSAWSDRDAEAAVARYGNLGRDFALRVYTTRLLGHDRYLAQGGDWGAMIATQLGIHDASACIGIHINMVVPGAAMRSKVLQIIDRLLHAEAVPVVDPHTGQPTGQVRPTIMPDMAIDDFTVLKQVVRQYCQENSDIPDNNPSGWQNLLAYFTAAVAMETQQISPRIR